MTGVQKEDIVAWQSGDEDAFARIYDALAEKALRYAAVMTYHDGLAADAVQETFLRVYRNRDRFDADKPFEPWYFSILRNECRRMLKWKRRLLVVQTLPEQKHEAPFDSLYDFVLKLPPNLREPLVLRYLIGYSEKEVADLLHISLSAAKARIKRAREKLRNALG